MGRIATNLVGVALDDLLPAGWNSGEEGREFFFPSKTLGIFPFPSYELWLKLTRRLETSPAARWRGWC